jgi:formate hydrogenlyase subunit 3/multisubunit Na+/H+ antiporter MnhD subunit
MFVALGPPRLKIKKYTAVFTGIMAQQYVGICFFNGPAGKFCLLTTHCATRQTAMQVGLGQ